MIEEAVRLQFVEATLDKLRSSDVLVLAELEIFLRFCDELLALVELFCLDLVDVTEQLLVLVQDEVVEVFHHALERELDDFTWVKDVSRRLLNDLSFLISLINFLFFERLLLPVFVEKALRKFGLGVEHLRLGCVRLLVHQHLLRNFADDPQSVRIELDLITEVLEAAQDRQRVAELNVVLIKPRANIPVIIVPGTEVIEPDHARHDTGAIVKADQMLAILLDVEDDDAGDLHLRQ